MNSDELITNIANKGAKKALPSQKKTMIFIIACLAIYLVILLEFFGVRNDLIAVLQDFSFQLELILNISVIISAIAGVVYLRLPSLDKGAWIIYIFLGLFLLFFGSICFTCCDDSAGEICGSHGYCFLDIILFALLPMFFLMVILRHGVLMNYLACSLAIGVASGSFAYLVERLVSVTEDKVHLIIWHFLPILFIVLISSILVKGLIKKL